MKAPYFGVIFAALVLVGCTPKSENVVFVSEGPRHPVTEKMETAVKDMPAATAFNFELKNSDGDVVTLTELLKSGPVVTISVKDECPCSIDSQPLFNDLAKKFNGKATFVGFFNEDLNKLKTWIKNNKVEYPVLLDQELVACKAYRAERSVYVSLVSQDGKILKTWPGYWSEMLKELDGKLTELTKSEPKPFDTKYAPNTPSSGCQLYEGDGFAEGDVR